MTAAACAMALHAWLAWGLNALLRGESPIAQRAVSDEPLQVVWLAPHETAQMPIAVPNPRKTLEVVAVARPRIRLDDPAKSVADPEATPEPSAKPLSTVLAGQARQWAQQQAPLEFAGADPLADRVIAIPGRRADRFRMTTSRSVADVVAMIGGVMGGPGPDPCLENRDDIAALANGRDAKALAVAVDYERRLCRP